VNTIHPPSISLDEGINRLMRSIPDFAPNYLEVTAEGATDDFGRQMFMKALHRVVEFRGITEVAERAGMTPEGLTSALSDRADMTVDALGKIVNAIGMKLAVVPVEPPKAAPKKRVAAKKSPRKASA